jgi:hypothetical protein
VKTATAPGGRGTELSARVVAPEPGDYTVLGLLNGTDPATAIRRALYRSKELLETGGELRLDPKPEGRRRPTVFGAITDLAEGMSAKDRS